MRRINALLIGLAPFVSYLVLWIINADQFVSGVWALCCLLIAGFLLAHFSEGEEFNMNIIIIALVLFISSFLRMIYENVLINLHIVIFAAASFFLSLVFMMIGASIHDISLWIYGKIHRDNLN